MSEQTKSEKKRKCFFITPIGDAGSRERIHADWVTKGVLIPIMKANDFEVVRADAIPRPGMITEQIIDELFNAEFCIADMTFLNPNVFYELGVAHAVRKPVIHIIEEGTKIPFDNLGHRAIEFSRNTFDQFENFKSQVSEAIVAILSDDYKVSNPLTAYSGWKEISDSPDPKDKLLLQLSERVEILEMNNYYSQPASVQLEHSRNLSGKPDLGVFGALNKYFNEQQMAVASDARHAFAARLYNRLTEEFARPGKMSVPLEIINAHLQDNHYERRDIQPILELIGRNAERLTNLNELVQRLNYYIL